MCLEGSSKVDSIIYTIYTIYIKIIIYNVNIKMNTVIILIRDYNRESCKILKKIKIVFKKKYNKLNFIKRFLFILKEIDSIIHFKN